MINRVLISKKAAKDLERVPLHIVLKLQVWRDGVDQFGLLEMRKQPGYHDEPLRGDRRGQRSIRLSRAYRAIYRVVEEKVIFVLIEEVNKHDY
jgi:proteic killer suppression protein